MTRPTVQEKCVNNRLLAALFVAATLASCRGEHQPAVAPELNAIARDYVLLSLTIGEKEAGYIDAYYGPESRRADRHALRTRLDSLSV